MELKRKFTPFNITLLLYLPCSITNKSIECLTRWSSQALESVIFHLCSLKLPSEKQRAWSLSLESEKSSIFCCLVSVLFSRWFLWNNIINLLKLLGSVLINIDYLADHECQEPILYLYYLLVSWFSNVSLLKILMEKNH